MASCSICKENFNDSASVSATYCGHVFHHDCIKTWRNISSTCPQCRHYDARLLRLYLNFEPESDDTYILKKQIEALKKDLVSNQTEKEQMKKQTEQQTVEISKLAESAEYNKRLYTLTLQELKREQKKATNLVQLLQEKQTEIFNIIRCNTQTLSLASVPPPPVALRTPEERTEQPKQFTRSVVVHNATPKSFHSADLLAYALELTNKLQLNCKHSDIQRVYILNSKPLNSTLKVENRGAILVITFSSKKLKISFLGKKKLLLLDNDNLIIHEYMSDEMSELFNYAKKLKKLGGYKNVVCKNNVVFIKKGQNVPLHRVNSKAEIDKIISEKGK